MWRDYIFGMHWKHQGKMYYDELSAESQDEAAEYFINHLRDDVSLARVQLVRPDDGGVRQYAKSPISSFDPVASGVKMRTRGNYTARRESILSSLLSLFPPVKFPFQSVSIRD